MTLDEKIKVNKELLIRLLEKKENLEFQIGNLEARIRNQERALSIQRNKEFTPQIILDLKK